ncbi:DNA recombination protein RmuC [Patescibacteria group bacterium]|nr:DNA recombination protein RmuC [Patescibacteria group bacterium]
MEIYFILGIFALLFITLVIGLFVILKKIALLKKNNEKDSSFLMIQEQINSLRNIFDKKLEDNNKNINTHLTQSINAIKDITKQMNTIEGTNKQILNLSSQIEGLENILKNPKQRGILGEYFLENLLKNVFPEDQYKMQYKFKDGTLVDAVIFVGENIIPVDSKFSLENYNRFASEKDQNQKNILEKNVKEDLKKRIDETTKYIKPDENTLDFAFMFIPSEGIYNDLIVNKIGNFNTRNLLEYAFAKKIIIVSPTSFFAYLQTVLQGLKALKMEESVKKILKNIEKLSTHLSSYDEYMRKLGTNLDTTVNSYNKASHEFKKIDKDIYKVSEKGGKIEKIEINKTS